MGHSIPDGPAEVSGDIADLLHLVTRRIRRDAVADLAPIGLTPALVRTLRTLRRYDGAARMSVLAEALRIARRSATTLVDGLVERGLVAREDDPSDRRAVLVRLTDRGVALLDDIDALRREAAKRVLRTLSAGDQDQLRDLLTRPPAGVRKRLTRSALPAGMRSSSDSRPTRPRPGPPWRPLWRRRAPCRG